MEATLPIFDTFAKRKRKAEQGDKPVVFRQDELPHQFRIQVVHIWLTTLGDPEQRVVNSLREDREQAWSEIHNIMCRELGVFRLWDGSTTPMGYCQQFLLDSPNVDDVLSLIELSFRTIVSKPIARFGGQSPEDAVEELNHRFREHGIGYQFAGGKIISVESLYLHTETVEPAVSLLHAAGFDGPLQEFMLAHEHYRKGNYKDAIVGAENAFESTMKTICDRRSWDYSSKLATAKNLIDVLWNHKLIPSEMLSHFTALRSTLESGLPTVRNQAGQGGHGQGADVVEVPDHLASYCLHLAATNIVFLIEAHNDST